MCEVTPYMVSVATKRGISVIYHSVALLISTTGVVYICYPFKIWRSYFRRDYLKIMGKSGC